MRDLVSRVLGVARGTGNGCTRRVRAPERDVLEAATGDRAAPPLEIRYSWRFVVDRGIGERTGVVEVLDERPRLDQRRRDIQVVWCTHLPEQAQHQFVGDGPGDQSCAFEATYRGFTPVERSGEVVRTPTRVHEVQRNSAHAPDNTTYSLART